MAPKSSPPPQHNDPINPRNRPPITGALSGAEVAAGGMELPKRLFERLMPLCLHALFSGSEEGTSDIWKADGDHDECSRAPEANLRHAARNRPGTVGTVRADSFRLPVDEV